MEKGNKKIRKYCGEIIDLLALDVKELYDIGVYEYKNSNYVDFYINVSRDLNKIYLDEYPEQEKLREEWFATKLFYKDYIKCIYNTQIYQYFYNRFMKRI